MKWLHVAVGLIFLILSASVTAKTSPKPIVDLLLVLATDTSGSVYQEDLVQTREAYSFALNDPRVLRAVRSGPHRRIAVAYVEWSGDKKQALLLDWTIIDSAGSAALFAERMRHVRFRSFADGTAIGSAIDFCVKVIRASPYYAERAVIDISGDGTNNGTRPVEAARDEAVRAGITINGLPVIVKEPLWWNPEHTNPQGGLDRYYYMYVVGGPGAFVLPAEYFLSFRDALIRKFIAEIASR